MLPTCPDEMPPDILAAAEALSVAYAHSPIRPRLAQPVLRQWGGLIDAWSEDSSLPLFIRKWRDNRGSTVKHLATGRLLVPCDNSPASWAVATAFAAGIATELEGIHHGFQHIPIAMVLSPKERQTAQFTAVLLPHHNVNTYSWKLDHIEGVGLNRRAAIEGMDIEALKRHFRLLMKPSNIVLVPMALKGLGDLPMFLDIIKRGP
ncbi:MAG: hypothetical protein ACLQM8_09380 [Limisphaerales bacterium]